MNAYDFLFIGNDGKLAIYDTSRQEDKSPTLSARNPFLTLLMQEKSMTRYAFEQFRHLGYGENTLLAYVLEAAGNGKDRLVLLQKLFSQITRFYKENPKIGQLMKEYLLELGEKNNFLSDEMQESHATRLFASQKQITEQTEKLLTMLMNNKAMSKQDYRDMGVYALPFNLQYIAQQMAFTYRMHHTS